jgi:hypothetical protein
MVMPHIAALPRRPAEKNVVYWHSPLVTNTTEDKKMRLLLLVSSAIGLAALVGCNESPLGGPKASQNTGHAAKSGLTTPEATFRLEAPAMATSIKQGESKTVTLKISRGKNFAQDVNLEFSDAPHGVTITPASRTFKTGASELQLTIEAAKDAAIGKHTISVTGKPATSGESTSVTFDIEVKKL